MDDFELKVRKLKERAAMEAFVAYSKVLSDSLSPEELAKLGDTVDGTLHSHDALLEMKNAAPIYIRCRWDFHSNPKIVEAARAAAAAATDGKTEVSY